jgi:L-ascorbate metabolism protein UlaG (beta-lactamase superfamily)
MTMTRARRWGTWVLGALGVVVAGTVGTTLGCASFGGTPKGSRLERMERNPGYREGNFWNEDPTVMSPEGNMGSTIMEFIVGNGEMTVPSCALPLAKAPEAILAQPPSSGLRITWLGHSTTLIEIDGRRILSDPIWGERASPFGFAGPKRFHPPPLAFADLPPIDAVIISHDHYDHLDMGTVRALAAKGVPFLVGLGVGAHLEAWGVPATQVREHEWWQETPLPGGVRIVSTPARHFSGRGLFNRNSTLWTSWSLIGPRHRVYFSGDTGLMSTGFETIREKLGPFDVSMLEIGQWHRNWGQIHLGPRGALAAHRGLGAKHLLPIHWATFELGLHAWSEPAETLVTLAAPERVSVLTPMLGEPIEPTTTTSTTAWWRELPPTVRGCSAGQEKPRALDQAPL